MKILILADRLDELQTLLARAEASIQYYLQTVDVLATLDYVKDRELYHIFAKGSNAAYGRVIKNLIEVDSEMSELREALPCRKEKENG